MTTRSEALVQITTLTATYFKQVSDMLLAIDAPDATPEPEPKPEPEPTPTPPTPLPEPTPTPTPTPEPEPTPPSTASYVGKPEGTRLTLAGQMWAVQSGTPDGVALGSDGSVRFKAKATTAAPWENSPMCGDNARKIRAELAGFRTFAKGEPIHLKGTVNVDPTTKIAGSDWSSLIQIHQADTRRDTGIPVSASPMFVAELRPVAGGSVILQIRGETGTGIPVQNVFSPARILGKVPFELGRDYRFDMTVLDGHGGPGRITFMLDEKPVCDYIGPTGYEYVDLLANAYLIRGQPQPSASYMKLGVYAGLGSGSAPPPGVMITHVMRDLSS